MNRSVPTREQLCRGARKAQSRTKGRDRVLNKSPHVRGVCLKVFQRSPKKPNSANRWVARMRMRNRVVVAAMPGQGNALQEHATVLLRGGRVKDLPGVRHRVVRGALDCVGVAGRITSRSKYGTPRPG